LLGKTTATDSANRPLVETSQIPQQRDHRINGDGDNPVDTLTSTFSRESLSRDVARAFKNTTESLHSQRSPLRPRQPSIRSQDGFQAKAGQGATNAATSSGSVAISHSRDFSREHNSTEPELPPTPTQLGLSPKPDRPRGLAASSSPSSRGSRRSRLRSEQLETSSPLKPKQKIPAARTEEVPREEIDVGLAEEAPESDVEDAEAGSHTQREEDNSRNDDEIQEEMVTKRRIRDDLNSQFARLQAETAHLENALNGGEDTEADLDPDLLDLLTTPNTSCDPKYSDANARPSLATPKDPIALGINPLAFLRAFAPGDLRLTTTTKSSSLRGRLTQAHVLNISAPPPWPPHIFNATFRVTCDVETKSVVSITGANIRPRHGAGIKELRHWMEARLKSPLHKFDAGTLVWGLGMWWKEAVARAQFFHHIDVTKARKSSEALTSYRANQAVKAGDVQGLLPYIGKSFVELISAEPYSNRASTCEERKYRQPRLLLKWDLELDWAGEVHTEIGVAGTKVSAKGQEGVKEVFVGLMRRNGLDDAVRQVVEVCGSGNRNGKKRNLR
jgi:hypothetical protein